MNFKKIITSLYSYNGSDNVSENAKVNVFFYFLAWHGLVLTASAATSAVVVYNFSSLFFSETTAPNISKLYIQLPYIGVYKNSLLHVDPIVDVDFIGL